MAAPRPAPLCIAAALPLLGGCAAQGEFPSLLPRAAEAGLSTEEPVRERAFVPSDPALRAEAGALLALARSGQAAFDAAFAPASAAVSRAGASGSESWVAAQQALSRLEAARAETTRALGALDALVVARAGQPTNEEDFAVLYAAAAEAARLAQGQQARLDRLRASVSPG